MTVFPALRRLMLVGAALYLSAPAWAAAAAPDTLQQRVAACIACHATEERRDAYFPRIAGKPAGYLFNQLLNFRDGRRNYPMMTYMVGQLSDDYLREIAEFFAAQHPVYPPAVPGSGTNAGAAALARGRQLVLHGDAARKIPACVACHGAALAGVAPAIPGLLGLPSDYINAQFGAWRSGTRRATAPDCMATIAGRLASDDVAAVSSWLSRQAPDPTARPAAVASLSGQLSASLPSSLPASLPSSLPASSSSSLSTPLTASLPAPLTASLSARLPLPCGGLDRPVAP